MAPADLLGRIEALNIMCAKCDRHGRYRVKMLVRENRARWQSGQLALSAIGRLPVQERGGVR
jgi:hypothetical protein